MKTISMSLKMRHALLAAMAAFALASCSDKLDADINSDPAYTPEELAEMAAADKFAAANSVIRALALLNELPENWESRTFEPQEGIEVDEASTDIRYLISMGADDARDYFHSIVPDLGLDGDIWSHEGVGTLTFREINEDKCYAVIDVGLIHMPGLQQIRFVPEEVVGENSFSGEGFYHAGDIVKDRKGVYWICVRPSGGPGKKSNAYFVSFDKSLIKTYQTNQKIYSLDENGKVTDNPEANVTGTWTYARNLVEERTAMAAAHTFAMMYGAGDLQLEYDDFLPKTEHLLEIGFDIFKLVRTPWFVSKDLVPNKNSFAIAYGSYMKNPYEKVRQEKYLQPFLVLTHEGQTAKRKFAEVVYKTWADPVNTFSKTPTPYCMSLTTDYDPLSFNYFAAMSEWNVKAPAPNSDIHYTDYYIGGYDEVFDIRKYFIEFDPSNEDTNHRYQRSGYYHMNGEADRFDNVLIMVQCYVKDHGEPFKEFTLVTKKDEVEQPDFWKSIDNTERRIFDRKKNMTLDKNIYN